MLVYNSNDLEKKITRTYHMVRINMKGPRLHNGLKGPINVAINCNPGPPLPGDSKARDLPGDSILYFVMSKV